MKKSIIVSTENGDLKINIINTKITLDVNICGCCYVKLKKNTNSYNNMLILALDLVNAQQAKRLLDRTVGISDEDLEFITNKNVKYSIWVDKSIVDKTFYPTKSGRSSFNIDKNDIKNHKKDFDVNFIENETSPLTKFFDGYKFNKEKMDLSDTLSNVGDMLKNVFPLKHVVVGYSSRNNEPYILSDSKDFNLDDYHTLYQVDFTNTLVFKDMMNFLNYLRDTVGANIPHFTKYFIDSVKAKNPEVIKNIKFISINDKDHKDVFDKIKRDLKPDTESEDTVNDEESETLQNTPAFEQIQGLLKSNELGIEELSKLLTLTKHAYSEKVNAKFQKDSIGKNTFKEEPKFDSDNIGEILAKTLSQIPGVKVLTLEEMTNMFEGEKGEDKNIPANVKVTVKVGFKNGIVSYKPCDFDTESLDGYYVPVGKYDSNKKALFEFLNKCFSTSKHHNKNHKYYYVMTKEYIDMLKSMSPNTKFDVNKIQFKSIM